MEPPAVRGAKRLVPVLALIASLAVVVAGCGGGGTTSGSPSATTSTGEQASYPVASDETGRQTLLRAQRYLAGKPALVATLEGAVRACGAEDIFTLAKHYGTAPEPLALSGAYAHTFEGNERSQAAALGCYLGAQIRQEGDQQEGERE